MTWNVIGKTGSLCLMMLFLATGALAQNVAFRADVVAAFTEAGLTDLVNDVVNNPDWTDSKIWTLYVDNIDQTVDTAPLCVPSPAINRTCGDGT